MKYGNGLSNKQVIENRKKYGTNNITKIQKESAFKLFLETLGDPIIKILIIALAIKTIFLFKDFDWYETIGIVIAILVSSLISTLSEYGSEKAFERLQEEFSKIKVKVLREGKIIEINIEDIVIEDILILESGDKIGADGIVIDGNIYVDESSMNGETKEQEKKLDSQVYRGTVVTNGNAKVLVNNIGNNTFYGKLAIEIQEKTGPSPLKLRLTELAKTISKLGYFGALLVVVSYLFSEIVIDNSFNISLIIETITNFRLTSGYILHALTLAVTIIVVSVPEGLPMMITLVLSSNMKRMLNNNVLVRKLVGIETAGSLNILFTDKTGTITKGKLEVVEVMLGNKQYYNSIDEITNQEYKKILIRGLVYNNDSSYDKELGKIVGGNITDRALLNFVQQNKNKDTKILNKISFNSDNKYSLCVIAEHNKKTMLIKGASEKILKHCTGYYDEFGVKNILKSIEKLEEEINNKAKKGMRVIVIAEGNDIYKEDLRNLTLVGIISIKDEVREEVLKGIELVKKAHIKTVMITGDNKETATSIAKEVGLIEKKDDLIITSHDLKILSDEKLKELLPRITVIARALPQDKSRLVRVSQEMGLVVGMTGDGVNDAPALKKADVGFAMGSGTDVSKEASDIIILDNNFISITKAILYGRTVFKSIRKFIIFQLTINLCAVGISIIGPFIGVDTPVTVIQMLWINMVMDTLAGLAFSYEPPILEYMSEYPKKKTEPILNKYMLNEILITGVYSSLLCIVFLKSNIISAFYRGQDYLMSAFFGLFIFMGIFNSLNARTTRLNLCKGIFKNKVFIIIISLIVIVQIIMIYFGGSLFRTVGLNFQEFALMLILASTVIPIDLIRKIYINRNNKNI